LKTSANAWRRYSSPRDVGVGGELIDRAYVERKEAQSRRRQWDNVRTKGFTGEFSDLGHQVVWELRRRNYSATEARYAGQLVSTGGEYNWQGNQRIARHLRVSERTTQRARARLERDGYITSHILERGQFVPGQRPVHHVQVVRRVQNLLGLARARGNSPARPSTRDTTDRGRGAKTSEMWSVRVPHESIAAKPKTAPASSNAPATPEELLELERNNPEFSRYFVGVAAHQRTAEKQAPRAKAAPVDRVPTDDRSTGDRSLGSRERVARARDRGTLDRRGRGPPD